MKKLVMPEKPEKCPRCGSARIEIRKRTFSSGKSFHASFTCAGCKRFAINTWIPHIFIKNPDDLVELEA